MRRIGRSCFNARPIQITSRPFTSANVEADSQKWSQKVTLDASQGSWKSALTRINGMMNDRLTPSVKAFGATMASLAKAKQWKESMGLLSAMARAEVQPNVMVYNSAMQAMAATKRWKNAIELFNELPEKCGEQPTAVSYATVINACGRAGQWQLAIEYLNEFEKKNGGPPKRSRSKPGPTTHSGSLVCYNSAISACDRGGQWQLALSLLERAGPLANIVTFNAAISACSEQGRWEEALSVLTKLKQRGLEPTEHTVSSSIMAMVNAGEKERGLELFREMKSQNIKLDAVCYNAAMQCGDAVQLMNEMKEAGIKPTPVSHHSALKSAVESLGLTPEPQVEQPKKVQSQCDKDLEQLDHDCRQHKQFLQQPNKNVRNRRELTEKAEDLDYQLDEIARVRKLVSKEQEQQPAPPAEPHQDEIALGKSMVEHAHSGNLSGIIDCYEKLSTSARISAVPLSIATAFDNHHLSCAVQFFRHCKYPRNLRCFTPEGLRSVGENQFEKLTPQLDFHQEEWGEEGVLRENKRGRVDDRVCPKLAAVAVLTAADDLVSSGDPLGRGLVLVVGKGVHSPDGKVLGPWLKDWLAQYTRPGDVPSRLLIPARGLRRLAASIQK